MAGVVRRCDAFDSFQEVHTKVLSRYDCLNPINGQIPQLISDGELNETGVEFIRGGIIALMAAWEGYVRALFHEAFDAVITVCSGKEKSLKRLNKQWKASDQVIQKTLKAQKQTFETRSLESTTFWVEVLHVHRSSKLDERTFQPIFNFKAGFNNDPVTIDGMFMDLFQHKESKMSDMVVEAARSQHFLLGERTVTLGTTRQAVKALYNISRLYYGLYCAFVGVKKDKVLKVLESFPDDETGFDMPTQNNGDENEQAGEYVELYMRIKQKLDENGIRRNIEVDYWTFLNIAHFTRFTAKCLKQAMEKWIYNLQPNDETRVPVWDYVETPGTTPPPN